MNICRRRMSLRAFSPEASIGFGALASARANFLSVFGGIDHVLHVIPSRCHRSNLPIKSISNDA